MQNIAPLHFILWGYTKDVVYLTKVKDISNLKDRITAAVEMIEGIVYYSDVPRATNGAHVKI